MFLAEPVIGVGGVISPPDDYFPRVRDICDRHGVLFAADEVITGFGRTGNGSRSITGEWRLTSCSLRRRSRLGTSRLVASV
jgi:glutamate-1-semialdehyde aminotransferase